MIQHIAKQSTIVWIIGFMSIFVTGQLYAEDDPVYTEFFSDKAVSGYDTVAYFTESKPVKGNKKFKYKYKGAVWYFKNQQNLDLFKAQPSKYAPQYGGYCAWSVARGHNASGDPEQWSIVNDKLYINYDQEVKEKWLKSKDDFILKANKNWPNVLK